MNELIDKLLAIDFVCVNINEEAEMLYNLDKNHANFNSIKGLVYRDGTFIFFRSLKTIQAYENFTKDKTLENHHLIFHFLLIDRFIDAIIRPENFYYRTNDLVKIVPDILQCAPNSEELQKELITYLKGIKK